MLNETLKSKEKSAFPCLAGRSLKTSQNIFKVENKQFTSCHQVPWLFSFPFMWHLSQLHDCGRSETQTRDNKNFRCNSSVYPQIISLVRLKLKVFTHRRFSIEHYPIKGNTYRDCHTTGLSGAEFKVKPTFVSNQSGRMAINSRKLDYSIKSSVCQI